MDWFLPAPLHDGEKGVEIVVLYDIRTHPKEPDEDSGLS